ncbi:MAG: InlB B-repeat-containing protein [Clostridium sp.]|nr:InlB B-repeat-containing protein [Clostridium sp.]MCM1399062.1 InlB B-repeat-containing protein [Clostridium sp.]MCM1459453.1 InlB B-repeat-containing protein [Bacteroides sp.]
MNKIKRMIAYMLVFTMTIGCIFVSNPNVAYATDDNWHILTDVQGSAVEVRFSDDKTASFELSAFCNNVYIPVGNDEAVYGHSKIGLYHFVLGANESYRVMFSYDSTDTTAADMEGGALYVYEGTNATSKPYTSACVLTNAEDTGECLVTNANETAMDCYLVYVGNKRAICKIESVLSVGTITTPDNILVAGESVSGVVSDTVYSYVVSPESGNRTIKMGTGVLLGLDIPANANLIVDVGVLNSLYIYGVDALDQGTYQGLNISRVSAGKYSIGNRQDMELPVYVWVATAATEYTVTSEVDESMPLTEAKPLRTLLRPTQIDDLIYNIMDRENYVAGNFAGTYIEGLAYMLEAGTYDFNFSYQDAGGFMDYEFNNSHLYIIDPEDGSYEIEILQSKKVKMSYHLVVPEGETRYVIFKPGAEGNYYGGEWTMELGGFEDASTAFKVPANPKDVYIYGWDNEIEEKLNYFYEEYPQYKDKVHFISLDAKGQVDKYKSLLNTAAKGSEKPTLLVADMSVMAEMKPLMVPASSLGITKKMYNSYLYEELLGSDAQGLKGLAGSVQPGCFIYRTDIAEAVLGTSQPEEVEAKLADWESFLSVAADMKAAGYFMTSGSDRLNEMAKGFDTEVDYYGQLTANGYDTGNVLGSEEWKTDLAGDTFGFFGSVSMVTELDSDLSYNMCVGPLSFSFGGTYIGGTSEAVGNPLAGLVLYTLCCDPYVMYNIAADKGVIPNNQAVVEKLINDNRGFTGDEYANMGGQNPLKMLDSAEQKRGVGIGPYTITYVLNSGKNNASNPAAYSRYTGDILLAAPTRTGYTFGGWYKDAACKTKITTIPKGSLGEVTLYAKWTANKYTIEFVPNGATKGTMKKISATYDVGKTLSSNAFKRTGYTFAGWNTRADGKGKTYKNKAAVKNLTASANGTVKLYATWKATKYTVKYYLRGGKNNSKNPTAYYVTSSTKTLKSPKRTGYTFVGWYSDAKYKKKVKSIKKGSTGNKKLYAKWKPNRYKIVFKGNGATSGKMSSLLSRKYGTTYRLPANKFVRDGYTFVGWSLKPNAKKIYKNKAKIKNLTSKSGGTVTLYARWKKNKN